MVHNQRVRFRGSLFLRGLFFRGLFLRGLFLRGSLLPGATCQLLAANGRTRQERPTENQRMAVLFTRRRAQFIR